MVKMNLEEAKALFVKHYPDAASEVRGGGEFGTEAGLLWYGFKSALRLTGHMEELSDEESGIKMLSDCNISACQEIDKGKEISRKEIRP